MVHIHAELILDRISTRLVTGLTACKLHKDAADGPNVAGVGPAKPQIDLKHAHAAKTIARFRIIQKLLESSPQASSTRMQPMDQMSHG